MNDANTLKEQVRTRYGQIAADESSCCGPTSCGSGSEGTMIGEQYEGVEGYLKEADLGLGCGLPTEHAGLHPGQTVLDLGSGAGLDAFIARSIVGAEGHVWGVDMTPEMVARARANAQSLGYDNVSFVEGDIEAMPIEDASIDVVISNCVLNLVPDKRRAFAEVYRVLRPGGHFSVSDIVVRGSLPDGVRRSVEMYVGCVAGAMERDAYLDLIRQAGFGNVRVQDERIIEIPSSVLGDEEVAFRQSGSTVRSVTVYGERPV